MESLPNSKVISVSDSVYPSEVFHIYAENVPANRHNEEMLSKRNGRLITMKEINFLPENIQCSGKVLDFIKTTRPSELGNLPYLLRMKVNASYVDN